MSTKRSIFKEASNPLLRLGLTPYHVRLWNRIQHHYAQEDFFAVEFNAEEEEDRFWRCHIKVAEEDIMLVSNELNQLEQSEYDRLDDSLKAVFTNASFEPPRRFWDTIHQKMNWAGCFIPIGELKSIGPENLELHIQWMKLQQEHFPFSYFFQTIEEFKNKKQVKTKRLPIIAIWTHFRFYVNMMKEISEKEKTAFDRVKPILNEPLTYKVFNDLLPSGQVIGLLYYICRQYHQPMVDDIRINHLLKQAHPSVQVFFNLHMKSLQEFYKTGFNNPSNSIEKNLKANFIGLFDDELRLVKIQELLDDESGLDFTDSFLAGLRSKLEVQEDDTPISERMISAIGKLSIMDRIRSMSDQSRKNVLPRLSPEEVPFVEATSKKWYDLSDQNHALILSEVAEQLSADRLKELEKTAKARMQVNLQNTLNNLCAPFFYWELEAERIYPQINLLPAREAVPLQNISREKQEIESREMRALEDLLLGLRQRKTIFNVNVYVADVPGFTFDQVQEKWLAEITAHKNSINNRYAFRKRRMEEFGILEPNEPYSERKNIWLNEMLQIEEEVKPYVLYVKEAFQGALPVRRTVEFNPFHHSHDGLEFDPMTIQDQDKWIRGDIMKTLRRRIDRGEVEQINAFCLDTSGSMDHERMRNLFKIIYLMVLGLEDRKSYDSFHFINTYFEEGVNFGVEYTNRTLLFNILRKIAKIKKKKGVVYGGSGGTNISAGVEACHERILKFEKELKAKKPDVDVARSLIVITDGEPSMGIVNTDKLHTFVEEKRRDGNVAIKGIYIRPEDDRSFYMPLVFGDENCIEANTFDEVVHSFVQILTRTYKAQRKAMKAQRKKRLNRNQNVNRNRNEL